MSGLDNIKKRRKELRNELAQLERQIYDLEGSYLENTRDFGNVFTGWYQYVSPNPVKIAKQRKTVALEERLFSLSSVTSPATKKEEIKRQQSSVSVI